MKRYSLIVALHIIGIAFLSVGVYLLVDAGLWFSALMAFLILLAIAVHLYRLQMMQVRMMRHLAESLRYDDMMLSFRSPYKNRSKIGRGMSVPACWTAMRWKRGKS